MNPISIAEPGMGLMIIFSILQAIFGFIILLLIESRIFAKLKSMICVCKSTIGDTEPVYLNEVWNFLICLNEGFLFKMSND